MLAMPYKKLWKESVEPIAVFSSFYGPHPAADTDNLNKLLMDALTGIFWENDRQVYWQNARKFDLRSKDEERRTEVIIFTIGDTHG